MTAIANAAYLGGTGTITIANDSDSDDYTAAVTSCALVPTAPKTTSTDIGGGVTTILGVPTWALQLTYNQDWTTTDSLSQKLIQLHGQAKEITYTPQSGGATFTITAVIEAGQVGGDGSSIHTATVTLGCNGQPAFA